MSNVILDVCADPASFASGATIQLVIEYRSNKNGRIVLSSSFPIKLSPSSAALKAAPNGGLAQFAVAIVRQDGQSTPMRCEICSEFFDSSLDFFVEVA